MPLPYPRAGSPPVNTKLSPASHAAILDDNTIEHEVRVAVLCDLEAAGDPSVQFFDICRGEELAGPHLIAEPELQVGRAITLASFERGLIGGWFGSEPLEATDAREFVAEIKGMVASSPTDAVIYIQAALDPGIPLPTLDRRVTWYYYDETDPRMPLVHVGFDLAHRLALPGIWGQKIARSNAIEFIVFALPNDSIDEPRKPRFTDSGALEYLEVWRPGGRTAPWIAGYAGLDEAVGAPTILARSISDVRITLCYEP